MISKGVVRRLIFPGDVGKAADRKNVNDAPRLDFKTATTTAHRALPHRFVEENFFLLYPRLRNPVLQLSRPISAAPARIAGEMGPVPS